MIVSPAGLIDSPVAAGSEAIRQLVAKVTNTPAVKPAAQVAPAAAPAAAPRTKPAVKEAPLNVQAQKPQGGNGAAAVAPAAAPVAAVKGSGQPAPEVSLPDLSGNTVNLKDFEGNPTMVLFWNPGCGFCRKMADDLKAWEANPPAGAPQAADRFHGHRRSQSGFGAGLPNSIGRGIQDRQGLWSKRHAVGGSGRCARSDCIRGFGRRTECPGHGTGRGSSSASTGPAVSSRRQRLPGALASRPRKSFFPTSPARRSV